MWWTVEDHNEPVMRSFQHPTLNDDKRIRSFRRSLTKMPVQHEPPLAVNTKNVFSADYQPHANKIKKRGVAVVAGRDPHREHSIGRAGGGEVGAARAAASSIFRERQCTNMVPQQQKQKQRDRYHQLTADTVDLDVSFDEEDLRDAPLNPRLVETTPCHHHHDTAAASSVPTAERLSDAELDMVLGVAVAAASPPTFHQQGSPRQRNAGATARQWQARARRYEERYYFRRARQAYQYALQAAATNDERTGQTTTTAPIHCALGTLYWKMGQYEAAREQLRMARDDAGHDHAGGASLDLVTVYVRFGQTYLSTQEYERAAQYLHQAHALIVARSPETSVVISHRQQPDMVAWHALHVQVCHLLGDVYVAGHNLSDAWRMLDAAWTLQRQRTGHCSPNVVAAILVSFGHLYEQGCRYDDAARCYLEGIDIYQGLIITQSSSKTSATIGGLLPGVTFDLCTALSHVGHLYLLLRQPATAMPYISDALQRLQMLLSSLVPDKQHGCAPLHRNVASLQTQMGQALMMQHRPGEAIRWYEAALAAQRFLLGGGGGGGTPPHSDIAGTLHLLGSAYARMNRWEQGRAVLQEALVMTRANRGLDGLTLCSLLVELANVLQQLHCPEQARYYLAQALNVLENCASPQAKGVQRKVRQVLRRLHMVAHAEAAVNGGFGSRGANVAANCDA